jgi:hypothetical protein
MDYEKNKINSKSLRYFPEISSNFELYNKLKLKGDKSRLIKREVLIKFRYPVFENELFVPDAYLYYSLDKDYKILTVPTPIVYINYQVGGLSNVIRKDYVTFVRKNINGYLEYANLLTKHKQANFFDRMIFTLRLLYYYRISDITIKQLRNKKLTNILFYFLYLPFQFLFLVHKYLKYKKRLETK